MPFLRLFYKWFNQHPQNRLTEYAGKYPSAWRWKCQTIRCSPSTVPPWRTKWRTVCTSVRSYQEMWLRSKHMRSIVWRWKISYCGIFCNWQEGSEAASKIPCHLYELQSLSGNCNVSVLRRIAQRLLRLCQTSESAGTWCPSGWDHSWTTEEMR